MAKCRYWVELVPEWGHTLRDGNKSLRGVKAGRVWKNRPGAATTGIIMEMDLEIDDAAFMPVRPKVALKIEAEDIVTEAQAEPVKVTPRQLSRNKKQVT